MPFRFPTERRFIVGQIDLAGRIQYFDDAFPKLLKMEPGDLLGRDVSEITHPDFRSASRLMLANLVRTGASYSIEKVYCDQDGQGIPALIHVCLLRYDDGSPEAAIAVIQPRSRWVN